MNRRDFLKALAISPIVLMAKEKGNYVPWPPNPILKRRECMFEAKEIPHGICTQTFSTNGADSVYAYMEHDDQNELVTICEFSDGRTEKRLVPLGYKYYQVIYKV